MSNRPSLSTRRTAWTLAACGLLWSAPATRAAQFTMPDGGTSWIEVSSNACDLGNVNNGGDCFGASQLLPPAQHLLEPPGQLLASGSVAPDRIVLNQSASGLGSGSFVWGATGGLFTLHGTGSQPVTVTATMTVDATVSKAALTSGTVSYEIGTWQFGAVASELNQRVGGIATDGASCSFNCPGLQLHDVLTLQMSVVPGQTFNLGFQLTTSSVVSDPAGLSIAGVADLALSVGPGFFITGSNGYDSRVSNVPEPGTWALMLAGLATIVRRGTARRA
jgi:hypothetical protein